MVLTCWSMEFQSITWRSTLTPVCLVYCSARPCQNGRVWSRLYSAITTLIVAGLPSPRPHADGDDRDHAEQRQDQEAAARHRAHTTKVPGEGVSLTQALDALGGRDYDDGPLPAVPDTAHYLLNLKEAGPMARVLILCTLVLTLAACASSSGPAQPQRSEFEDVPVPAGLTLDSSRTTIIESPTVKAARLFYKSRIKPDSLAQSPTGPRSRPTDGATSPPPPRRARARPRSTRSRTARCRCSSTRVGTTHGQRSPLPGSPRGRPPPRARRRDSQARRAAAAGLPPAARRARPPSPPTRRCRRGTRAWTTASPPSRDGSAR